jgi:hypothetical protein
MGPLVEAIGGIRSSCTSYTYDSDYRHFVGTTRVPTNGCDATGSESAQGVAVAQSWDRGFGIPVSTISSGTLTTVELDGFGRTTKVFDPSATTPNAVELVPQVVMTYYEGAPVSRVETVTRSPQGVGGQTRVAIG